MKLFIEVLLLLLGLCLLTQGNEYYDIKTLLAKAADPEISLPPFLGRHNEGFALRAESEPNPKASAFKGEATLQQKLDHFDSSNSTNITTWTQRIFYNLEYALSDVNIIYIEGERAASLDWITSSRSPFVGYAKELGAAMYALEHRFYGESRPTADMTVDSLQFLTSRQAIEDLATFIKFINDDNGKPNQKWIAIGGSYAGNLALWLRQQHPELVIGALGASAPLLAQVDFYGYVEVVENDIRKYDTNSTNPEGQTCEEEVGDAFDHLIRLLQSEAGRNSTDRLFNCRPRFSDYAVLDENIIALFYERLISIFNNVATHGGINGYPTMSYVCNTMTMNPGYLPIEKLAALITQVFYGGVNANYTANVEYLDNDQWSLDDIGRSNARAWRWQLCNEFGSFESTNKGSSIFRSTMPSNYHINWCKDVYGIGIDQVKKNIDATNAYYGERNYYKGTNVVITHGTHDPWNWLTKKDTQHESVVISSIKDGVHRRDFYFPCLNSGVCNNDVAVTQNTTLTNFRDWVTQYEKVPDSITIRDRVGERPRIYEEFHNAPLPVYVNAPTEIRGKRSIKQKSSMARRKWNVFTGRSNEGLLRSPKNQDSSWPPNLTGSYIEQRWDHFNNTNTATFSQRFFVNEKFGTVNGPNFLMIGGEGPEFENWMKNENLAWIQYAKNVSANLYLLEHRYYRRSKLRTNDLQYLTSAQMIYDVAHFINVAKKENNALGPWIVFGGSHSGPLSAWAREWFPELIAGAVASSAPVETKSDFYEYLMVVESVLRATSDACANRTKDAFFSLQQLTLSPDGRKTISDKFSLSPPWFNNQTVLQDDIFTVFGNIYGYFQDVVQNSGNNRSPDAKNVSSLCAIMTDPQYTDPLDALKAVFVWVDPGSTSMESSFDDGVKYWKKYLKCINGSCADDTDHEMNEILAGLQWNWQTCNEFGYFQSTDYGSGIFGNPVPINMYVKMCEQIFGVTMNHVEKAVGRTIYQYGGRRRYKGTNVVLPNGSHDPWHALGLLDATGLDPTVVPILINGTAHCADMYEPRDSDPQQLKDARETILTNIRAWIRNVPITSTTATSGTEVTTTDSGTGTTETVTVLPVSTVTRVPDSDTTTNVSGDSFTQLSSVCIALVFGFIFN